MINSLTDPISRIPINLINFRFTAFGSRVRFQAGFVNQRTFLERRQENRGWLIDS